jgi:hypothetical protein
MSDFRVWRHTWRKNWVNCAVLKGNSAGLRTVLSIRLSHTELCSSLRESHSFLRLPAKTTMASSQGIRSQQFIQQMSIAWYIPFQISLLTPHYAFFSSFRITLWPMWLANSRRKPCFIHHSHTHKKTNRTDKKTDKPDGKHMLCERTFSSDFRAVFLHS